MWLIQTDDTKLELYCISFVFIGEQQTKERKHSRRSEWKSRERNGASWNQKGLLSARISRVISWRYQVMWDHYTSVAFYVDSHERGSHVELWWFISAQLQRAVWLTIYVKYVPLYICCFRYTRQGHIEVISNRMEANEFISSGVARNRRLYSHSTKREPCAHIFFEYWMSITSRCLLP